MGARHRLVAVRNAGTQNDAVAYGADRTFTVSDLGFVPGGGTYPMYFTAQGGGSTIGTEAGHITSCSSITGNGKFATKASGDMSLWLSGCKMGLYTCTSAGKTAGTIVSSSLSVKPVYLDAAKTKFGLLPSPPAGQSFASFSCLGAQATWTGSLIGEIAKPALNVSSSQADLAFEATGPGVQKYQQIEGAGAQYRLTQTMGGTVTGTAISGLATLTFAGSGKFIP